MFTEQQRQQLVAVWARDTLGLSSKDYNRKVQTYKNLNVVWRDRRLQQIAKFTQENTVIIDDSLEKVKQHPFNLIAVPEYTQQLHLSNKDTTLSEVKQILAELLYCTNVSSYLAIHKPDFAFAAMSGELYQPCNTMSQASSTIAKQIESGKTESFESSPTPNSVDGKPFLTKTQKRAQRMEKLKTAQALVYQENPSESATI